MKKIRLALAVIAILAAVSCHKPNPETGPETESGPRPGDYMLPVIETTDIHGHILSDDGNGTIHYRLSYVADKADDLRGHGSERKTDRLLLLDGGDLYQGASISNLLDGRPVSAAFDVMGYDAVALGNHEFDWGVEKVVDSDATMPDYEWDGQSFINEVPVLCANLYKDGARVNWTQDYTIVEKTAVGAGGEEVPVKIGIIGFAIDYSGSIIATQFNERGFSINEDYAIPNNIAARLEESGECDATILLIHGEANGAAAKLGEGSPIDLVLGGHSHRTMYGKTSWGLPFLQGGRYCEHYARADIWFSVDADGSLKFSRIAGMSTPVVDSARDTHSASGQNADDLSDDVLSVSDAALAATEQQQNEVLGYIKVGATTYDIAGSGGRATTVSNWMCDILRRVGDADVAFVNGGGIRTTFPLNGQSSRNITVADVYEMFPFSNPTYVYELTYAELLTVFEYSMTSGGQSLFSLMTGMDCYYTETDHGSYSTYAVHSLRVKGEVIYQNGVWTGDWASRSVTLAVSEYLAITERTDYYTDIPNPLPAWNKTSRLLGNNVVDNVGAVEVLRAEAGSSGGLLYIDTSPHFIIR